MLPVPRAKTLQTLQTAQNSMKGIRVYARNSYAGARSTYGDIPFRKGVNNICHEVKSPMFF